MAAQSTQALMMQLVNGSIVSQALRTVAELEIADRLSDGPKTADELAALSGANAGALQRVLRALSSIGIFEAREGRVLMRGFGAISASAISAVSRFLASDRFISCVRN